MASLPGCYQDPTATQQRDASHEAVDHDLVALHRVAKYRKDNNLDGEYIDRAERCGLVTSNLRLIANMPWPCSLTSW